MDNGQGGSSPPTRDGCGNTRRVIGIRRINYSGTGLPPVETASSPEDIHSGGSSTSEPLPEKQGESPETPGSPELPALNQQEIQAFYRESLLAMKVAESARGLATSNTPDNELMFYDSASSSSQATNLEPIGSRSDMAQSPHEDRMSLRSIASDDLRCEGARATSSSPGDHSSRANTSGVSISRAGNATADDSISRAPTPAADDGMSRVAAPSADDSISRAATPSVDDSISRVAAPSVDDSISRVAAPSADDSISRVAAPSADDSISRASAPASDDNAPENEVASAARETTGIRKRLRRASSRLLRPFRQCFGLR